MDFVVLNKDNIADEHICCAFSDKKCSEGYAAKKHWLSERFKEGYIFRKLDARGKVFMEYCPAEFAWNPVDAKGYIMINCFWVSGKYKKSGYGRQLYELCENDSKSKNGIVVITGKKKMPFLSDKKFFEKMGFELCDSAPPYFELWCRKFNSKAPEPKFRDSVRDAECDNKNGFTAYYSNACPFTEYYVKTELARVCDERNFNLKIIKIDTMEQAQKHVVPFTIFSLFLDGKFLTHQILSEKMFDKLVAANYK